MGESAKDIEFWQRSVHAWVFLFLFWHVEGFDTQTFKHHHDAEVVSCKWLYETCKRGSVLPSWAKKGIIYNSFILFLFSL